MNKPKILAYLLYGLTLPLAAACRYSPAYTSSLPVALAIVQSICFLALIVCIHKERETFDFRTWEKTVLLAVGKMLFGMIMIFNTSRISESRGWFADIFGPLVDPIAPYMQIVSVALGFSIISSCPLFSYVLIAGEVHRATQNGKLLVVGTSDAWNTVPNRTMNILLFWAIALLLLPLFLTSAFLHSGECFIGLFGLNFVVHIAFIRVFNDVVKTGVINSSLWTHICAVSSFWLLVLAMVVLLSPYFLIMNMSFGCCFYALASGSMAFTLSNCGPPQMECAQ